MRVDGHSPSSSVSLHLDPRQARMIVTAELGVSMGDDAAVYLSVVLQHTIERLLAGALTSCGKPDLRTKYGGTGKDVQPGADVQPRHLQDFIRTDKDFWGLFNSAFAFQVILSVFLDHATETCFRRLGLPIHSREALASCEYYATVVDGLKQKKSAHLPSNSHTTGAPIGRDATSNSPPEHLPVATPAQLSRVAARVNPLCSLSPKACLMTEALIHETFMALCEGVIRSRPDTRVITIVDLDGGIRDVFPEGLAVEAARAGKEAMSTLAGDSLAPSVGGEVADDHVRLCVRRLQGTRTLLRKTFRVSRGSLLFAVFTKACERLRIHESSVIFVQDGMIVSGSRQAGELVCGATARSRTVEVFAVCKRAWACKQRAAARRGLLLGNGESSITGGQAGKRFTYVSGTNHSEKPWRQKHLPSPYSQRTRIAAPAADTKGTGVTHHQPLIPLQPPPEREFHSFPPGLGTQGGGEESGGISKRSQPRRVRRWIATPTEGTKLDLGRLEDARAPFPLRQRAGGFKTGLLGSASGGALVGSNGCTGVGGGGAGGVVASPRIERTVRRLSAMEACLRNLEDSMKELQLGGLNGRPSGISSIAMAAITSQLDVAYNLSSLCRHAISSADEDAQQGTETIAKVSGNQPAKESTDNGPPGAQGQLRGGVARGESPSFLTEVPTKVRNVPASSAMPPQPRHPPVAAPDNLASEREAVAPHGRVQVQDRALGRQPPRPERLPLEADQRRLEEITKAGPVDISSNAEPPRRYPGGIPMQRLSSGSGRASLGDERRESSKSSLDTLHEGGIDDDCDADRHQTPRTERSPVGARNTRLEEGKETGPVDGSSGVLPSRQYQGEIPRQRLSSGSGRSDMRYEIHESSNAVSSNIRHEGGTENGGDGDGHQAKSAAPQSYDQVEQPLIGKSTIPDIATSSSWSSMVSQGQHALEEEYPEEEEDATAADEAPPESNEVLNSIRHKGGTENGGDGDGHQAESAGSQSSGQVERSLVGKSTIPDIATSSWSSMASQGQHALEEESPEEEEDAYAADEAPSSWGSMLSIGRSGDVGEHPSPIAEDPTTWSGSMSELQPSSLPEAMPVKINLSVSDSAGGGARASPPRGSTSDKGRQIDVEEQRRSQDRGHRLSEGEMLAMNNVSERAQAATRHAEMKLHADDHESNGDPPRTTLLNPEGDEGGNIDGKGGKPMTTATGTGGDLGRINTRLPSGTSAPRPEPERDADPYGDGDWEDMGDEEDGGDDDGNWSSWAGMAGGG